MYGAHVMLNIKAIVNGVGSLVYPNVCLCCKDKGENGLDLCSRCFARLPWIKNACEVCALPLAQHTTLDKSVQGNALTCGACSTRSLNFDHAYAPFLYEDFIRIAIHQFKFNYKLNYGKLLAQVLFQHVVHQNIPIPDVFIPVPLHKTRIKQRGFNQALEITKLLAEQFDCSVHKNTIQRVRETKTQMELPAKKRKANVKNAFILRPTENFSAIKHAVIIDDVMTTGSTVNEVAKCVKAAGVAQEDVWCVARVP